MEKHDHSRLQMDGYSFIADLDSTVKISGGLEFFGRLQWFTIRITHSSSKDWNCNYEQFFCCSIVREKFFEQGLWEIELRWLFIVTHKERKKLD